MADLSPKGPQTQSAPEGGRKTRTMVMMMMMMMMMMMIMMMMMMTMMIAMCFLLHFFRVWNKWALVLESPL